MSCSLLADRQSYEEHLQKIPSESVKVEHRLPEPLKPAFEYKGEIPFKSIQEKREEEYNTCSPTAGQPMCIKERPSSLMKNGH